MKLFNDDDRTLLPNIDEDFYLKNLDNWKLTRDLIHKIKKVFQFPDFQRSINFINKIAIISKKEGYYPEMTVRDNRVKIELYDDVVMGLTENDFAFAMKIDSLARKGQIKKRDK